MTIDDALDIADNEGLTPKENYVALTALAAEVRRGLAEKGGET